MEELLNHQINFDFNPRTRMIFGIGSFARLGEVASEYGGSRALLVSDPGIVVAGHVDTAVAMLTNAGLDVVVYDQTRENPTTRDVSDCVAFVGNSPVDLIIGLGGGSSLDTAKGCNFILTNGGDMKDYRGYGKATRPMLPMIAVPTTAGTGSEAQSFALIADETTHAKMACGDPKAAAKVAILDPELTLTQPRAVTLNTGIDALAHAVESGVTTRRNAISDLYASTALRLIAGSFGVVLEQPDNLEARGQMLLGAAFAGTAIENSMLGAAHSAANPLTAHFGITHGQAVGLMLPSIMRFNAIDPGTLSRYSELARSAGTAGRDEPDRIATGFLITKIDSIIAAGEFPRTLSAYGIKESDIAELASEAATQWTAQFNPRPIGKDEFVDIYRDLQ